MAVREGDSLPLSLTHTLFLLFLSLLSHRTTAPLSPRRLALHSWSLPSSRERSATSLDNIMHTLGDIFRCASCARVTIIQVILLSVITGQFVCVNCGDADERSLFLESE